MGFNIWHCNTFSCSLSCFFAVCAVCADIDVSEGTVVEMQGDIVNSGTKIALKWPKMFFFISVYLETFFVSYVCEKVSSGLGNGLPKWGIYF